MFKRHALSLLAGIAGAGVSLADVWDNFPATETNPNGYDTSAILTSERNTQVGPGDESATWVIDDATFETDVYITAIEWIGVTELHSELGLDYAYSLADWGIFTGDPEGEAADLDFNEVAGDRDVEYTRTTLDTITLPGFSTPDFEVFLGRIDFQGGPALDVVSLNAGTYWFGTRAVGDASNTQNGGTGGRHMLVSGSGHAGSISEAFNLDRNFILSPWDRASNRTLGGSGPIEFAYRIYYDVVPEPGTLGLLLVGGLLAARRRGR